VPRSRDVGSVAAVGRDCKICRDTVASCLFTSSPGFGRHPHLSPLLKGRANAGEADSGRRQQVGLYLPTHPLELEGEGERGRWAFSSQGAVFACMFFSEHSNALPLLERSDIACPVGFDVGCRKFV
jgi:hypothetical protein